MEDAFKAQVVNIFEADSKFEASLARNKFLTAEDFALICSKERLVDEEFFKPAAADGVHLEIKDKINIKKLWKACRKDDDTVAASGLSNLTEFDKGFPERTRKSCVQLFLNKHGYALPPGRRLVGTKAAPIYSGSHNMPPDPKDFSLLPVRLIKMEPMLPYSPFSQLNANTCDECLFGDVVGLELSVRAMGELGLNLGKVNFDLVVRVRQGCGGDSSSPTCGVGLFEQAQEPRFGLKSDLPGRREQDGVASVSPPISPWRKELASVASHLRSAGGNLFWELFAGVAILSRTFKEEEWRTGPPIDIVYMKAFNLMYPGFFMVVLDLVLEGWVSVLHLGPPSLSFSTAINRRASKRIRANERLADRENLSGMVRIGNELAQVTVTLAKALMIVERWFQLVQWVSSLMLHLPSLKEVFVNLAIFKAVRRIGVDGVSWFKRRKQPAHPRIHCCVSWMRISHPSSGKVSRRAVVDGSGLFLWLPCQLTPVWPYPGTPCLGMVVQGADHEGEDN